MHNRVRAGNQYIFDPVGWDVFDPKYQANVKPGDIVIVVNLPGAPKANTMGHAHILGPDGKFGGLVSIASLRPF